MFGFPRFGLKKVTLGLLVAIALTACTEQMTLYKSLVEKEVNLMTAVLLKSGLEAVREENKDGTYNLVIKDARYFPEAMDILSRRGFPREKFDNLCTIFKGEGMVSTPLELRARYTCAKSQELAGSLMQLDGVINGRVHLVLAETDAITRKMKPASASVIIKHKSGMDISTLIPKVKQLVSFGVESLPYQNVSIMLTEETEEEQTGTVLENTETTLSEKGNGGGALSPGLLIMTFLGVTLIVTGGFVFYMLKQTKKNQEGGELDLFAKVFAPAGAIRHGSGAGAAKEAEAEF